MRRQGILQGLSYGVCQQNAHATPQPCRGHLSLYTGQGTRQPETPLLLLTAIFTVQSFMKLHSLIDAGSVVRQAAAIKAREAINFKTPSK